MTTNDYTPEWWKGEGYYSVKFSDGGQDFTNDGPVWLEDEDDLVALYESAWTTATETHVPYVECEGMGYDVCVERVRLEYDGGSGLWREESVGVTASSLGRTFTDLDKAIEYVAELADGWGYGEDYTVEKRHGKHAAPTFEYSVVDVYDNEEDCPVERDDCHACSLPADVDPRNS